MFSHGNGKICKTNQRLTLLDLSRIQPFWPQKWRFHFCIQEKISDQKQVIDGGHEEDPTMATRCGHGRRIIKWRNGWRSHQTDYNTGKLHNILEQGQKPRSMFLLGDHRKNTWKPIHVTWNKLPSRIYNRHKILEKNTAECMNHFMKNNNNKRTRIRMKSRAWQRRTRPLCICPWYKCKCGRLSQWQPKRKNKDRV